MNEFDRCISFRKLFLLFASKFIVFIIMALAISVVLNTSYCIKEIREKKEEAAIVGDILSKETDLTSIEDVLKNSKYNLEQLNLERNRILNTIEYNSVAKSVFTYSISNGNSSKDAKEIDLFYKVVSCALNNNNIARKLHIANKSNNLYSIDLSNAIDFDNSILLIVSISTKNNDILTEVENSIDELIRNEFASFNVTIKSAVRNELDLNQLESLKTEEQNLKIQISNEEKKCEFLKNSSSDLDWAILLKGVILRTILGFIGSFLILGLLIFCKIIKTPYISDVDFAPKCLGLQNLAELDSGRIKKNWLTKLFMRKATYSNKDAYGIVRVYLKEKENLSVLSFLDSKKENEFKKETGANVVNCNGDLSELFKVIADKNNFVILIDTETTRTKQVVEVYNFVKNLGLEMYGAVVYTI